MLGPCDSLGDPTMKFCTALLTLLLTALPALAADEEADLSDRPGYVDFSVLAESYGEPRVMIDLGSSLLQLVGAMKHDDPVAEEALRSLESVRIHVYNTAGDTAPAEKRIEHVNEVLSAAAWEKIVRVREPGEQVDIYVKHSDERIEGVTVMALDGEEAVFINILGSIAPEQLATVVGEFDHGVGADIALAAP